MARVQVALAGALACSVAMASEPVKSVDAFEADARRCLAQERDPATCLEGLVRGRWFPGNEKLNDVVPQITGLLRQWLGKDTVYAVHRVKEKKLAEFFEERVYMIEDSQGNLMMLETAFVSRHGRWYVLRFNVSSQLDTIQNVLGVKL